ncbi:PREDICTED: probable endo-1,3(4)-beta-glucanase ARB_01444 [Nelumbo nucifera]|uniref:glucan endo-1,3-beta-D-glucosidase n=2 Tax=Nelumbo nucifera TaxID=4432 RepID=A0A822XPA9_NELNU|nr:PREDICTED: probable endo-1,3(4)-beta-glucanase ARB_01444 [Nelumbo nucifera]DAD20746.1 TPA_asm: hypothetical protein HUJ06_022209 [Nelumbo nucifera]
MQNPHKLFPEIRSSAAQDPAFFSPELLSSPLPTNSFFQNFVLKSGDGIKKDDPDEQKRSHPEYIHPYLIKPFSSSLAFCYPSLQSSREFVKQDFAPDLIISSSPSLNQNIKNSYEPKHHVISSFNDLSVTLDLPPDLRFFLVRGSPFLTCKTTNPTGLSIQINNGFEPPQPNSSRTKHTIRLRGNKQTWICYSSSPIELTYNDSSITVESFTGIIRFAILLNPHHENILDRFSACYPVSGCALFSKPFWLEYAWQKKGQGDLLILAHPLHLKLLDVNDPKITLLREFKYDSIDGELIGVVGDSWIMKAEPISPTWHSIRSTKKKSCRSFPEEIKSALHKDIEQLNTNKPSSTTVDFGKVIARAARLALIAEEVMPDDSLCGEIIDAVKDYLDRWIGLWLSGEHAENGFGYETKWKGITSKNGAIDGSRENGFGIYNDRHFQLGYFIYAIAVLAKLKPELGRQYRIQAYGIMEDIMTLGRRSSAAYPRLRCFDAWKLHSWAAGLYGWEHGRNQKSPSEAVNAYYSAALMGKSYGDTKLEHLGMTLAAFEIQAAKTWWHVRAEEGIYSEEFAEENRVLGRAWSSKRDNKIWNFPSKRRVVKVGVQVMPLTPITEVLFPDVGFVGKMVEWALTALDKEGDDDKWKGFVYAMEGVYDKERALDKIRRLKEFEKGSSLSNLLWWIHTRHD